MHKLKKEIQETTIHRVPLMLLGHLWEQRVPSLLEELKIFSSHMTRICTVTALEQPPVCPLSSRNFLKLIPNLLPEAVSSFRPSLSLNKFHRDRIQDLWNIRDSWNTENLRSYKYDDFFQIIGVKNRIKILKIKSTST